MPSEFTFHQLFYTFLRKTESRFKWIPYTVFDSYGFRLLFFLQFILIYKLPIHLLFFSLQFSLSCCWKTCVFYLQNFPQSGLCQSWGHHSNPVPLSLYFLKLVVIGLIRSTFISPSPPSPLAPSSASFSGQFYLIFDISFFHQGMYNVWWYFFLRYYQSQMINAWIH